MKNNPPMQYHLYCCSLPPLDWTFCFFTVNEFKERIRKLDPNSFFFNQVLPHREAFLREVDDLLQRAEAEARQMHWDGVYRDEPLIFAIPAGEFVNVHEGEYAPIGTALLGIIIKQDNDGDTFIYSPIEMKHLEM